MNWKGGAHRTYRRISTSFGVPGSLLGKHKAPSTVRPLFETPDIPVYLMFVDFRELVLPSLRDPDMTRSEKQEIIQEQIQVDSVIR